MRWRQSAVISGKRGCKTLAASRISFRADSLMGKTVDTIASLDAEKVVKLCM
jgi:hypothetical protein